MNKIGFVGAGNMARALGGGLRGGTSGAERFALFATDPDADAAARFAGETGGKVVGDLAELMGAAEVVILAVKPQVLPAVLTSLSSHFRAERHVVISIAAGIRIRALERGLGAGARVIRAMPNTPALVRKGITVLAAGAGATREDVAIAEEIFAGVGEVAVVDDEALLDAVTAVSGSGPGFAFAYGEAMIAAAMAVGLPPDLAVRLVRQTLVGSAFLWQESGEAAEVLRQRVTSPGGTTQAGLEALEARSFSSVIRAAIEAATRRSRELSAGGGEGRGR